MIWQNVGIYNILFLVVKMFEEHIFTTLQEKIGFSIKNSHLMVRGEFTSTTIHSLPQLTPQQIRMLCKAQEQTVILSLPRFFNGYSQLDLWISTKRSRLFALREGISKLSPIKRLIKESDRSC
jgi:hypothetical protein